MAYLLDSDVIIDFLKRKKPGFSIISDLIGDELYINAVSWAEIVYGIRRSRDPKKRMGEFERFLKGLEIVVLPIDQNVANKFIELKIDLEKKGRSLADFDLLIASSAITTNLALITGNKKHFSRIKELKLL